MPQPKPELPNWRRTLEEFLTRKPFSFSDDMAALNYRPAAVLILFWDDGGQPATLVTVRSANMPTHAGEISFPGGGLKPGEDFAAAALREANEEIGLDPDSVKIVGYLDDAWSGAGFALKPVIGICESEPVCGTSEEVDRVVKMNMATEVEFLERSVNKFGNEFQEPVFRSQDIDVVGLSADLLTEALDAIEGKASGRGQRRQKYFLQYGKARKSV